MAKPVVTCGADQVLSYSASPRTVGLTATATGSPIYWRWDILSVPPGSTANVGTHGDFVDGVATVQNPDLEIDGAVDGAYCVQCRATNSEGESDPASDKAGGQQIVMVRTELGQVWLPPDYAFDWGERYLNPTLRALEIHATAHQNGGYDEIAVATPAANAIPKANGSAKLDSWITANAAAGTPSLRQLGTGATDACAGNDSRLSDARTPTTHATSHKSGGGDSIKLDELAAPTDVTTLNATIGAHGLLPKLSGSSMDGLRGDGTWGSVGTTSPLTTKGDLYTFSTVNTRLAVGTNGKLLSANSGQATGLEWVDPPTSGFLPREEEFTATGGDQNFALAAVPATNANMLSGKNIIGVYRNGQRLRYRASPATGLEWGFTATQTINCKALTAGDIITVVYGS
ncbi:MAG: hypothetical protein MUC88_00525 [Planctomycetes bacterium]|jgi:hypothetical protein|nr:hypothetical protein [Planctomycetota bacterium]